MGQPFLLLFCGFREDIVLSIRSPLNGYQNVGFKNVIPIKGIVHLAYIRIPELFRNLDLVAAVLAPAAEIFTPPPP